MAEPHLTTIAAAGAGIGIGGGMLLGASVDALIIGLLGALFISFWMETINSRKRAAAAVLFSSMLAGYGSPVLADWVIFNVTGITALTPGVRLLGALLIGSITPLVVPFGVVKLRKLIDEAGK